MRKLKLILFLFLFIGPLFTVNTAIAHPGRTDSSGGHTCRTNCPDWGLEYGEYHFHGGYTAPEQVPYIEDAPEPDILLPDIDYENYTPSTTYESPTNTTALSYQDEQTSNFESIENNNYSWVWWSLGIGGFLWWIVSEL